MRVFSFLLLIFFLGRVALGATLEEGLTRHGLVPAAGARGFVLSSENDSRETVLNGKSGEVIRRLQIHEVEPQKAAAWLNLQRQIVDSAYSTKPSPYMAPVTKELSCGKDFLPVLRKTGGGEYLAAVTNARLAYGVCTREQAGYQAGMRFFYDGRRLVKSECFVPYGAPRSVLDDCVGAAPIEMPAKGF